MTDTQRLTQFLAALRYEHLPPAVVAKTKALFIDWLGCVFAAANQPEVKRFTDFATQMGADQGVCGLLIGQQRQSPYFAALIHGAAGHALEQDDLHNGSVLHPATVVFPAALAAAEDLAASGQAFIEAVVVGYEAGIRIGEFLGRSHYQIFHTTATVGTLAAAVAVGKLHGFNAEQMAHALGNAGTQAAGLWAFLVEGADSKPLHSAKANADGLLAAYLTAQGLKGAQNILESPQGLGAGLSRAADASRLADGLGKRWALLETSLKLHACCRHTHPAADAFLQVRQAQGLRATDIAAITCYVHQAALDVLGKVTKPTSVHQAKFSMGTVLGLLACHGEAYLSTFEHYALTSPQVAEVAARVTMVLDPEIEAAYPKAWRGKVLVETVTGERYWGCIDAPKGDPSEAFNAHDLSQKFYRLVAFSGVLTEAQATRLMLKLSHLNDYASMRGLIHHLIQEPKESIHE
ncbi:MAG: MmgE/PrpD family protein [Neisseriaceae bacterium]|nr:MmgE/PrpD family protein [Neisseriaceae bacterium]